jgi:hypothetical protein
VLLGVGSDNERGDVDNLLANANVALSNQHTGMVDGLGQSLLENLSLKTALQESLGGKLQDIIQRALLLSHQTESLQSANKGGGLEESLGVLGVKSQQGTGGLLGIRVYQTTIFLPISSRHLGITSHRYSQIL